MDSLAGVQKLFVDAADEPELGDVTRQMYLKAPEPKDQASIGMGILRTWAMMISGRMRIAW